MKPRLSDATYPRKGGGGGRRGREAHLVRRNVKILSHKRVGKPDYELSTILKEMSVKAPSPGEGRNAGRASREQGARRKGGHVIHDPIRHCPNVPSAL